MQTDLRATFPPTSGCDPHIRFLDEENAKNDLDGKNCPAGFSHGWWIVPSILIGALLWVLILLIAL
jgi:hypothetical protein